MLRKSLFFYFVFVVFLMFLLFCCFLLLLCFVFVVLKFCFVLFEGGWCVFWGVDVGDLIWFEFVF